MSDTDKQSNITVSNKADYPTSRTKGLKPWKLGESGNLAGRPPKVVSITSKVKELLEQDSGDGKTNLELVAEALITLAKDKAFGGNVPALKELLNRIEGKVADKIEGTENPVTIILRPSRDRG